MDDQQQLFPTWRYHAFVTNRVGTTIELDADHRRHAVCELAIRDLKHGAGLRHCPSGSFLANAAWLVCAAIAFNLTRAAGALASTIHAKATTSTIRRQLIAVPARLARSARQLTLHLPINWPSTAAWQRLHIAANAPPPTATT